MSVRSSSLLSVALLLGACAEAPSDLAMMGELEASTSPEAELLPSDAAAAPRTPNLRTLSVLTGPFAPGETASVLVRNARPFSTVWLVQGYLKGRGPQNPAFGGLRLSVTGITHRLSATADAQGDAFFRVPASPALNDPAGSSFLQAAVAPRGSQPLPATSWVREVTPSSPFELIGVWSVPTFGTIEVRGDEVTTDIILLPPQGDVTFFDNAANLFVFGQPGLWFRADWIDGPNLQACVRGPYSTTPEAVADNVPTSITTCPGATPVVALPVPNPIAGTYTDGFGSAHQITNTSWDDGFGTYEIYERSDEQGFFIARNAMTNFFNPGLWSRFEITTVGSQLYYCQQVFDAPTLADARSAPAADPTSPATGGCGTAPFVFSWTALTPVTTP